MFAVNAYKVQVELDDAILKRENVGVNQKIKTDVTGFMADLLKAAQSMGYKHKNSAWNKTCVGWKEQYAVFKEPHDLEKGGINFYEFAEVLSNVSQGNETIVTDAGSAFYVMGQAFRLKADQRYIVSGAFGAMGYALPASIGAAVNANTPVVCVTGDGSLQMNIQELQTLRHNQFSIKLFIINNDGYLSIRNTQDTFFNGHHVGSDGNSGVSLPEISKIAEAYHIPYLCCENREELTSRLQETLEHAGPIICEIMCKADQKIIPAVSSKKREDGSMVSMPIDDMFPFLSRAELDRNRLKPE
jgi:acetolactate synthase-1/2/3 large subunit